MLNVSKMRSAASLLPVCQSAQPACKHSKFSKETKRMNGLRGYGTSFETHVVGGFLHDLTSQTFMRKQSLVWPCFHFLFRTAHTLSTSMLCRVSVCDWQAMWAVLGNGFTCGWSASILFFWKHVTQNVIENSFDAIIILQSMTFVWCLKPL